MHSCYKLINTCMKSIYLNRFLNIQNYKYILLMNMLINEQYIQDKSFSDICFIAMYSCACLDPSAVEVETDSSK